MAHVNFDGLHLRLTLTTMEKCAVGRGDVRIHRSRLVWVTHSRDIWDLVPAHFDLLGVGYPGMHLVGTAVTRRDREFCVIHGHGPGLAVTLREHEFARVLFSIPKAEAWPLFARLRDVTDQGEGSATA
jgi:hypothetical protein